MVSLNATAPFFVHPPLKQIKISLPFCNENVRILPLLSAISIAMIYLKGFPTDFDRIFIQNQGIKQPFWQIGM